MEDEYFKTLNRLESFFQRYCESGLPQGKKMRRFNLVKDSFPSNRTSIASELLRDLAPYMLLLPHREGNSEEMDQVDHWMIAPIRQGRLSRAIRNKIVSLLLSRKGLIERHFELIELMGEIDEGEDEINLMPVGMSELIRDLRESMLENIYRFHQPGATGRSIKTLRLFRRIWEIISGHPRHPVPKPIASSAEFLTLWKRLRRGSCDEARFTQCLMNWTGRLNPSLMITTHIEEMLLFELSLKLAENLSSREIKLITLSDLGEPAFVLNPFYTLALQVYDEAEQAIRPYLNIELKEDQEDLSFLALAERERSLQGSGEYRNFSVNFFENGGGPMMKLSLFMDPKPFLQQIASSPVFIFWDLKEHPFHIILQLPLEKNSEIPLSHVTNFVFFVESNHPSICKHAFVRQVDGHPCFGTICTENTNQRILALHRNTPSFDPVTCLLEQMRGAARVLRYGVRERDREIRQHNPFQRVDRLEYQEVIEGWARARAFAREHEAEIIPYRR